MLVELGTSGNPTADSCRVYNYYAGVSNPTTCAPPAQGTNNNGNVAGYYYDDNTNSGLNHTATYSYDPGRKGQVPFPLCEKSVAFRDG